MKDNISFGGIQFNGSIKENTVHVHNSSSSPTGEQNDSSPQSWKVTAIQYVAEGKLLKSLAEIEKFDHSETTKIKTTLLMGRLNKLAQDKLSGISTITDQTIELNQIREAILVFIATL